MGRASRWLKNLLGGKKETKVQKDNHSYGTEDRREKKRWSFTKSGRDSVEAVAPITSSSAAEAMWLRSLYAETEREQSKHAIAVAAATAAAADAAVAAAQAAVAVVRLTSQGRGTMFGGDRERRAAEKIQKAFRGYLAKKALRALKALVKLQALVRGYLVRKQAAATLYSMQSLIRAQAIVRARKSRNPLPNDQRLLPETRPRRSLERFDETRSEHLASFHSRRLSGSLDNTSSGYDRSPKIVEIDTCRPKSRSSRRGIVASPLLLDSADDVPISSPLPSQIPPRISIPECRNFQDYDRCLLGYGDTCRFSATAQSTPRYMSSAGAAPMPVTPAKSVCGADGAFRRFLNHPNYMANTQSFEAKVRSQSAPKQRPEQLVGGPRKRIPLSEMVESRASLSAVGVRRSCSQVQEPFSFKSAVVGRLDRSAELARELESSDYYLQRKW